MQSAVIWDLNGVIIDDMPFHLRAFQQYLRQIGYEMTEQYFLEKCTGTPPNEVFGEILPVINSSVSIQEATERKRAIYFDLIRGNMRMLPGVGELIDGISITGIRQAIASGATRMEVETILSEFGIQDRFGAVVACEDVTRGKPDPEPFELAASRLGVSPESCLVIEDGAYGIRAAHACGMKVIAVTNTQPRVSLAEAELVVDSLADVSAAHIGSLLQA